MLVGFGCLQRAVATGAALRLSVRYAAVTPAWFIVERWRKRQLWFAGLSVFLPFLYRLGLRLATTSRVGEGGLRHRLSFVRRCSQAEWF